MLAACEILRLAAEQRFAFIAVVRFFDGEFDFRERLAFANTLIVDGESRMVGVSVDFSTAYRSRGDGSHSSTDEASSGTFSHPRN